MEILQPFLSWLQADWTHAAITLVLVVAVIWIVLRLRHEGRRRAFHAKFGFIPSGLDYSGEQKKVNTTMDGLDATVTQKESGVEEARQALHAAQEDLGMAITDRRSAANLARYFRFQVE